MKITLIFSCFGMFRHVPERSAMFRNVPCSGFYRRPIDSIISEQLGFQEPKPSMRFLLLFTYKYRW